MKILQSFKYRNNPKALQDRLIKGRHTNTGLSLKDGRAKWILDAVRAMEPENILEIGPQTGGITRGLIEICKDVAAIDIVPENLKIVGAMGVKTHLCFIQELHRLDIGQFDVVILAEVLNHVEDVYLAMANAWGKVKRRGWLIVTVPIGRHFTDDTTAHEFNNPDDLRPLVQVVTGYEYIAATETLGPHHYACKIQKRRRHTYVPNVTLF